MNSVFGESWVTLERLLNKRKSWEVRLCTGRRPQKVIFGNQTVNIAVLKEWNLSRKLRSFLPEDLSHKTDLIRTYFNVFNVKMVLFSETKAVLVGLNQICAVRLCLCFPVIVTVIYLPNGLQETTLRKRPASLLPQHVHLSEVFLWLGLIDACVYPLTVTALKKTAQSRSHHLESTSLFVNAKTFMAVKSCSGCLRAGVGVLRGFVPGRTSSLPVSLRGQFLSLALGQSRKEGGVDLLF